MRAFLRRDLKTQNVFVAADGTLRLGDFGVSKVLSCTTALASTAVGTPYYLSPEICENKPYDHKSDVWSLGCVLYEMLTLTHPFEGASLKLLILKIIRGKYPPVSARYGKALRDVLDAMLSKNPAKRPGVNDILKKAPFKDAAKRLLEKKTHEDEFSHTVIHAPRRGAGGAGAGSRASSTPDPPTKHRAAAAPTLPPRAKPRPLQAGDHATPMTLLCRFTMEDSIARALQASQRSGGPAIAVLLTCVVGGDVLVRCDLPRRVELEDQSRFDEITHAIMQDRRYILTPPWEVVKVAMTKILLMAASSRLLIHNTDGDESKSAGVALPEGLHEAMRSDVDAAFLRSQSDAYTDAVYEGLGADSLVYPWSRFVSDPTFEWTGSGFEQSIAQRFADEQGEPAIAELDVAVIVQLARFSAVASRWIARGRVAEPPLQGERP